MFFKSAKAWLLIALLIGPFAIYIGLGFLWLLERGWLVTTLASFAWVASGVAFYILGDRWTGAKGRVLPPIDWNSPETFSPADTKAWGVVKAEAERGESVELDTLTGADLYINTGRKLANDLARLYHPVSEDPIENVPVIELLTALELAAEDLTGLCRQVPGGDMFTTGHWKAAVQAAAYIQKANNIYSYILPMFNPVTGLPRLASQHLMVKPAWKSMQANLLRWFYQAYVNRLGTHLIELYSGRLVIGSARYRRLTRKAGTGGHGEAGAAETAPLRFVVAGSREAGSDRLVAAIKAANAPGADRTVLLAKLGTSGLTPATIDRLLGADWHSAPGYTAKPDRESARDRSTRRGALAESTDADLLVLLVDDRRGTLSADAAFAADRDRWYLEHPNVDRPPALAGILSSDTARIDAARAVLPPTIDAVIGLPNESAIAGGSGSADPAAATGMVLALLPALAAQLPRAERLGLLRQFRSESGGSKAGRLFKQFGDSGRKLWSQARRGRTGAGAEPSRAESATKP